MVALSEHLEYFHSFTKAFIYPLQQCLWLTNFAKLQLFMIGSHKFRYINISLRGVAVSLEKIKPLQKQI